MKRTKQHSAFFALIESNIAKPNTIKWERPIVDLVTQESKPKPTSFGVSLENAFANAQTK
jgi:hypothetical protein